MKARPRSERRRRPGPAGRARRRRPARTPVERLRTICLALPETTEKVAWGEPTWVGVRIDRKADWAMVATLVEQAYRLVAPPRLRDGRRPR
jgi:hypothetical protein